MKTNSLKNQIYTFGTKKGRLQIIPDLCGCITGLRLFNGKEPLAILDSYKSNDDTVAKAFYKSHFLLPFPNRMKDGQFSFEGKNYQFPINDTNNQHNLHGFLELIPMDIVKKYQIDSELIIELNGQFQGLSYFPFPFEITIRYRLSDSALTIDTTIKNTGETNMPIGFGWHPYFKLDTDKVDELKLQLPDCQSVMIDNRMIPTGELKPYTDFENLTNIGQTQLDNCFILNKSDNKIAKIILQSQTTKLIYWQQSTTDTCPYFQIYTPDTRQSIAIEPMTCNVDAFNNKNGLWTLAAGETKSVSFGVRLSKIS